MDRHPEGWDGSRASYGPSLEPGGSALPFRADRGLVEDLAQHPRRPPNPVLGRGVRKAVAGMGPG